MSHCCPELVVAAACVFECTFHCKHYLVSYYFFCYRNFSFGDVHIDGARAIAEAARLSGVERFIHFSALNASVDSPSKFLQSKAYGEEVVLDAFPSATIIRPSDTYGHEDRFLNYYASLRVFPFGMIPLWNGGEGVEKRPVYVS